MKKLLYFFINTLFLVGCSDPVNETIKNFKNSNNHAVLDVLNCGGLSGTLDFSIKKTNHNYNEASKTYESTPTLEIILKKPDFKEVYVKYYFSFNNQTKIFQFLDVELIGNPKSSEYDYEYFCSGKPFKSKSIPESNNNHIDMQLLYSKYVAIANKGIGIEEFERLAASEKLLYVAEDDIGKKKFCMNKSQFGFIVNYMPTGTGVISDLIFIENCKIN